MGGCLSAGRAGADVRGVIMSKSFVFVVRQAPYSGVRNVEMLDQILAATAFDLPVDVLFLDDGVLHLQAGQITEAAGLRPFVSMLQTLILYDVREIAVEAESLDERALPMEQLVLPVRRLARAEIPGWIAGHEVAVSCG